ncbi:MAG: alpha/beta fold hydrolase [Candidatus Lokiarchaeota archaeon]|nr:alpha/beta fold hydrolase [Candidatus Lokiarchaeota archaeon]
MIDYLRTPEERFKNIPNFPYEPRYIENMKGYEDLRMAYYDEGPKDSNEVFLCLHGEPTWSFLYRKMIPIFLKGGYRVIAPDFFGFGRSDKPVKDEIYTFNFHRNSLIEFIKLLDLDNTTLIGQDWGGILGLTLPMEFPNRFKRLILMNTILGTGDFEISQGFKAFRDFMSRTPDIDAGRLIRGNTPILTSEEVAAYNAPFIDIKYKAGIRRFPQLVPTSYDAPGAEISRKARDWFQNKWNGESFMAVGMADPVLGPPMMEILRGMIPRCPKPMEIKDAAHFVQEWGEEIAKKALEAFKLGRE